MLSNSSQEETIVYNDINSYEIKEQNRCSTNESAQMNQSESSNSSKQSISDESNNNDIKLSDSETSDAKCSIRVERKKRQNDVKADDPTFVKKKKVVNPNMLAETRIATFSASNELMNLDLKELLKQSLEGKAVLQSYEINECLEEDDRTALVDIIVKWLLFRITQPKKLELTILKDKILTLFTNEENVYYIAPKEEGENQCLARGKLFDRTKNLKEWMRKKNLLPRVHSSKKNAHNNLSATEKVVQIEPSNEIKTALNWLKNVHEPWNKVEEKWTITSKYRRDVLLVSRSQAKQAECNKATTYLDEYKVLRFSRGYTLIEIDFALSCQPGLEDALITNWHSFSQKIEYILKNSPELVKDPEGKKLRQLYFNTTNEESKDILLGQCLPSLLPPSRQIQLGKKKFKPTIKESRDAFIANVKISGQVLNFIAERRVKICNKFGRSASVQPYILYVGKELDVVDEILVVIDNFHYKLGSFQQALDVCFKTFFALDMIFTTQCDHVWLLIQKALYGFTTKDDVNILKVTSFLKKLELMGGKTNIT